LSYRKRGGSGEACFPNINSLPQARFPHTPDCMRGGERALCEHSGCGIFFVEVERGGRNAPTGTPSDAAIERQVIEAIGEKLAGLLKDNTPSRICGLLTARGRNPEWEEALEHIADHFRPVRAKPTHSVFCKRLRDPTALKDYIKRAAATPSTLRLSKMNIDGRPIGAPCMLIIREFKETLGQTADQTCLIIVANFQGKLVTAYPASKEQAGLV
jgi:hypothetical protein